MLTDIADVIKAFAAEEAAQLDALGIKHAPTIGAMYERMTDRVLLKGLPPGVSLKVANGFITNRDDYAPTTGQIDCMLVKGEGRRLGDLDSHIWHVRDVIAVLEVKKNLFTADLEDAFDQLRGVADTYDEWVVAQAPTMLDIQFARRAFADVSGQIAPTHHNLSALPQYLQVLFHSLVVEQNAPIRIALGYDGFSSEFGLRRGYLKFMKKNEGRRGFGVRSLPNLIIVGSSSLIKLNGQPYSARMNGDWWPVLASGAGNPLRFMLELIWTRLLRDKLDDGSNWYGNDLSVEILVQFIDAQLILDNANSPAGWNFRYKDLKGKDLKARETEAEWEPTVLNDAQHVIFVKLTREDVDTTDVDYVKFGEAQGGVDAFTDSLVGTGLVARSGKHLVLTTTQADTMILPDGRFIVGENASGQLSNWLIRYLDRRKENSRS